MTERLVAMTFEEASRWIASQEKRIETLEAALRKITDMHPERWHNIGCGLAMKRIAIAALGSVPETPAHCEHGATNPPHNCAICSGLETPVKPLYRSKYEMPDGGYIYGETQAEADGKVTAAKIKGEG